MVEGMRATCGHQGHEPSQADAAPFPYRIDTCVWEITLACNYRCAHCGSAAGHARPNELSTEETLGVADQLAQMGCRRCILIGGEVFFRRDWPQIARRLHEGGVEPNVITNGSLLKDAAWDEFAGTGIRTIAVSVDGCRENADATRQPGSFDAAMEALEAIKAHGLHASAITVINPRNIADLERLRTELAARNVDAWQIQLCSPFGNAGHSAGVVPSHEQIRSVIDFAAAHNLMADEPTIYLADNIGYFTEVERTTRGKLGSRFPGCAAGLSVIGIDSVGNVRGCESLYDERFIEGNLRERTLRSIWEDPGAFAYNRHFDAGKLSGMCAGCKLGSLCGGGCRSLNYFGSGDMYQSLTCVRSMGIPDTTED